MDSSSSGAGLRDAERGLRDLDKTARTSGDGFTVLKGLAVNAISAIASAALAAGAAVGGFVKDSVSAAGTFEASVNGLAAVAGDALGDAGVSLEDVSDKALQLGKDTQFSAQESIQAMTELAKGGVPIASVMTDATDATLALAAAAGVPLANAAEIVAKQLGVWGETGVTASEVTDIMASAANASTVGVEDLALGVAQAGGTAKTAGVEFDDLVQTMALIAPNFSSASDAGTSLKTMLSRLIPTTDPAKAAMAELGLYTAEAGSAFFDASGSFIGMEAAAGLMHEATAGLSEEQKLLAFNTIFGSDAIRAAAAIANAGAPGFANMGQAMEDTGGAAAAAKVKQQGFAFAMEQLMGSIETAQIIIGTAFLPILTSLIEKFTGGVNAVAGFVDRFKNLPEYIMASDDPLRTFMAALANMIPGIGPVIHTIIGLYDSFKSGGPALSDAAILILGWLGSIAGHITSQMAAWAAKIGRWVIDALPGLGANLATLFQSLLAWFAASLPGIVDQLAMWGMQFVAWIKKAAPLLLTELGVFFASMLQFFLDNAPQILSTLATWTAQFLSWAAKTGLELIVALGELFGKVLIWMVDKAPEIEATIAQWKAAFLQWVIESWPGWMTELGKLWSNLTGWISEQAGKLSADGSIGSALVAGIKKGIDDALSGLIAAARSAVQAAISAARSVMPGGGGGGSGGRAGGGFAMGGPLHGAAPYLVGEHGPELFVPASAGGIVPAGATAGIVNRTTNNYFNQTVNSNASASTVAADFAMLRAIAGAS